MIDRVDDDGVQCSSYSGWCWLVQVVMAGAWHRSRCVCSRILPVNMLDTGNQQLHHHAAYHWFKLHILDHLIIPYWSMSSDCRNSAENCPELDCHSLRTRLLLPYIWREPNPCPHTLYVLRYTHWNPWQYTLESTTIFFVVKSMDQ